MHVVLHSETGHVLVARAGLAVRLLLFTRIGQEVLHLVLLLDPGIIGQ